MGDLFIKLYVDEQIAKLRAELEAKMASEADALFAEITSSWEAFLAEMTAAIDELKVQINQRGVSTDTFAAMQRLDTAIDQQKEALAAGRIPTPPDDGGGETGGDTSGEGEDTGGDDSGEA